MKQEPPIPGGSGDRLRRIAAPLLAVGLLLVVLLGSGSTICAFALATGIPCPGCGMTRATVQLLQGHFAAAQAYHPLVLLVLLELIAAGSIWFAHGMGWIHWRHRGWVTVLLVGTAILLLVVWVYRLATGTAPPV